MIKKQFTRLLDLKFWFLSILLSTITFSCHQSNNNGSKLETAIDSTQRQDLLTINEKPPGDYTYHLEWGELILPLEKYANPNVHKGAIEVDLATFLKIIGQKIKV